MVLLGLLTTKVAPKLVTQGEEQINTGLTGLLSSQDSLVIPGAPASPLDTAIEIPSNPILGYSVLTRLI